MDFLTNARENPPFVDDHEYIANRHPITKVADRFILYDRLHERNSTVESDRVLRSTKLVPDLRGRIKTVVCEERNRGFQQDA